MTNRINLTCVCTRGVVSELEGTCSATVYDGKIVGDGSWVGDQSRSEKIWDEIELAISEGYTKLDTDEGLHISWTIERRFLVWDNLGVERIVESDDMECALESVKEDYLDGDWEEKQIVTLTIQEIDDTNEDGDGDETMTAEFVVGSDPEEPCEEHDWQSPYSVLGGCSENPGVWGSNGTTITTTEVCAITGWYKVRVSYGSQRNPGQCDSIRYDEPDEKSEEWVENLAS